MRTPDSEKYYVLSAGVIGLAMSRNEAIAIVLGLFCIFTWAFLDFKQLIKQAREEREAESSDASRNDVYAAQTQMQSVWDGLES